MTDLRNYVNPKTERKAPLIAEDIYKFVVDNDEKISSAIVYDRDMNYDFFAFKTLERAYLLKLNNKIAERPQHMIMRGKYLPLYCWPHQVMA